MRRLAWLFAVLIVSPLIAEDWKPAEAPLMTRWAKDVSPENVLPEYPRPQMVREKWQNLNGLWDYAIVPKADEKPTSFDGKILVPFCAESVLSGVGKRVGEENKLWYRRTFTVPADWEDQNVLLHFGAVDWQTTVWVNGEEVGRHEGGYDPFNFDITDALKEGDEQDLVVAVWDPTDKGPQPRGKQVNEPRGIWYTPVTGIWQTVWLEPVPETSIESLRIEPRVEKNREAFRITTNVAGETNDTTVQVTLLAASNGDEREEFESGPARVLEQGVDQPGRTFELTFGNPRLWTPDDPWLYELKIELVRDGQVIDVVNTYSGLREIKLAKAEDGFNRLFLNGEPLFQFGPLDQGWWPDGLYTAPTDEALKYDVEMTKKLGFNMARKHVKVEPARWYYHCDKLGLLVWQDMPNGDAHIGRGAAEDITRTPESEAIYRQEWQAIVESFRNHPSIVVWVPFNEGWGQFKTNEILAWTKELDPTRLVDGPSGWEDRGEGDLIDMHMYPGPGMFPPEEDRATVLGEYGGLGWPVEGHLWQAQDNWGYRTYQTQEELIENYKNLTVQLPPLIGEGLAAAIYTQTTDVEIEVNGLMTYDRKVIKFPVEETATLNRIVYGPPTKAVSVVPTSEQEPQTWRYTTDKPTDDWNMSDFDDSSWKEAPGGFGTEGTPGGVIRTTWDTPDIWLRRTIELPETLNQPAVRVHHDENVQIYLNGVRVASRRGHVTGYTFVPLHEDWKKAFKPGKNVLAVHCHQTGGGQYIDVGVVDLMPVDAK